MSQNLEVYLDAIEQELDDILQSREQVYERLYGMMRYHMGWVNADFQPADDPRGKRLRPTLCLLACEAAGGEWRDALPAAAAIELIHNFSLIHDDIEDNSQIRRHRTAVWSLWGLAQGVNTGDTMWAVSRLATYRLLDSGYQTSRVLRVIRQLDKACLKMCQGQYLDIHFETVDSVSLVEYERMIAGKTAALLSAALAVGAILSGARDETIACYRAFGRELGMTFQITDDFLGVWGNPSTTGKSVASDILEKKKTLPVVYALQWERERGFCDLAHIYTQHAVSEKDVPTILKLMERAGAQAYTHEQARVHQQLTLEHLQNTGINHPAQKMLRDIAISIIDRSF